MDDGRDDRLPRIAPILLLATMLGFVLIRPGNLAGEGLLSNRMGTALAAVLAVGYVAWRFHGLLAAAAAIVLLRLGEPNAPSAAADSERGLDVILLLTLALAVGACSRQGRRGPGAWILLTLLSAALALFGWFGYLLPASTDAVAASRTWHLIVAVSGLALVVGGMARSASWLDRLRLVGVIVALPAAGLGLACLIQGAGPTWLQGSDWPVVVREWRAMLANDSWQAGSWCWSEPWIVAGLLAVGLWRTLARGRRQWQRGQAPTAWLLAVAGTGVMLALAARPFGASALALAAIVALVAVFGVADLIQAIVERFQLEPPEPGPSNVPRVS